MECPNCGDRNTTVKDSRKVEMNVFRTRYCSKCGNTFYTEEISIDDEYGIYISTAEYCHPGLLTNIRFCPMCGRELCH